MKAITFVTVVILTFAACLVSLMPHSFSRGRHPQTGQDKIQKLQSELRKIDDKSGELKIKVKGEAESSAAIEVKKKNETLLDINISDAEIPDEYIDQQITNAFAPDVKNPQLPNIKVMQIGASKDYEVVEDYSYNAPVYTITVHKGFVYDRASIPRMFWIAMDKDSLSNVAPVFHDLLYRNGGVLPKTQVVPHRTFSRKETDDLFFELMIRAGVKEWRAKLAYQAVRRFAEGSWKKPPK